MTYVLLVLALAVALFFYNSLRRRRKASAPALPDSKVHELMQQHIRFYSRLGRQEQNDFRLRANALLEKITITPVGGVVLTDLDRLYVAAAALIPIFRFSAWTYNNLSEVLIYPGNFSKDFLGAPEDSNVMGMVGDGHMHRMMILSIGALRTGFEQEGRGNTGIHEFVHLLDKADGAVDGIPEVLLPEGLVQPWLDYMQREIADIREGDSDINPYGATSQAEFLAVISEYFFQRPEYLKEAHPELWALLERMYKPEEGPGEASANAG